MIFQPRLLTLKTFVWTLSLCVLSAGCAATDTSNTDDDGLGGDEDEGPVDLGPFSCDTHTFSACGGDLVGTWDYIDACVEREMTTPISDEADCSTSFGWVSVTDEDLNMNFESSGAYTSTLMLSGNGGASVTEDCAKALDPTASLAIAITGFANFCVNAASLVDDPRLSNVSCSVNTAGGPCECQGDFADTVDEAGTYTSNETSVYMVPNEGDPRSLDYCVDHYRLYIAPGGEIDGYFAAER